MSPLLKISRDFSKYPGVRYPNESKFSGQEFRENMLRKAISEAISTNTRVTIDLDGTSGYAPSFLEESFGGLIREDGMNYKDIVGHIEIISLEEPELKDDILQYLMDADKYHAVGV